jgi:hypothetical protein
VSGEAKRIAVSHPVVGTEPTDSKQGGVSSPSRPVVGESSSAQEETKDSKRQQPVAAAGQSVSTSSSALRIFSRQFSRTGQQPSASTTSVTTSSSSSLATSTQSSRVQDQKARNSSLQTNPLDEEKESGPPPINVQDEKLRSSLPQLLPGVYVGDSATYRRAIQQQGAGFAAAIKLTAQRHDGPSTTPIPEGFQLLDLGQGLADSKGDWPTLKSRLPQAFALLDQALSQGQQVLLFCTPTLSHSLAVVQAYLIYQSGITAVEADTFVKAKLPQAQNPFLPQLKTAENELIQLGRNKAEAKEGRQQAGGTRPPF